jgi:nucleotide-binding universal stress UspA family protein
VTDARTDSPAPLRILVPLDGSADARLALQAATWLQPGCLTLLYVDEDDGFLLSGLDVGDDERLDRVRSELEQLADARRAANREVAVDIRTGDPAGQIIEAARDHDLIVMTTRGRGAAGRALFGSVADRVSRSSTVPTMLIRAGDDTDVIAPSRILTPLDGSETAERALPLAVRLATALACSLHLVRAIGLDDIRSTIRDQRAEGIDTTGQSLDAAGEVTRQRALEYLEIRRDELGADGVDIGVELLDGTPAFALLWEITESDLVVMSSHGRGGYRRWLLGSVAEKLVREAKGPVVLVPTRDPGGTQGA